MMNTNHYEVIDVELLLFLILFPLLMASALFLLRSDRIRGPLVATGSAIIIIASLLLLIRQWNDPVWYSVGGEEISLLMLGIEGIITLYILYAGLKFKKYGVIILALLQTVILAYTELFLIKPYGEMKNLFIDQFSVIMALIIGVIGSLICVYAISYMREYHHHHPEIQNRVPFFFFILFLFLSAMFGLVFSNNLMWIFMFWEITTLCSFLLIGYSQTEEATNNAFWALLLNLAGGVAFIGGIAYLLATSPNEGYLELNTLIQAGPAVALIPAVLISIAGLSKSAQLPFSSWLVGAMVAPTPVSALLHSSTMVKAGVYIIVRFAPVFEGQMLGMLIALIGGVTFLVTSCIAIGQSNAKKVLAYSTIANLGLVVACAGVGTPDAVWAAILLIIFHAIAKSLLFLSVGTIEHRIGSRDIEDMAGLISAMPRVATMVLIGIAGMFLAPFGMLLSKWATLHAFVEAMPPYGIILVTILAYGGAVTLFFWAKWMGKVIEVTHQEKNIEGKVAGPEWTSLYTICTLVVLVCFLFPVISWYMIEPYLRSLYTHVSELLPLANVEIMLMMLFLILVMPLSLAHFRNNPHRVPRYLGGLPAEDGVTYVGSLGMKQDGKLSNYYLDDYFEEKKMSQIGNYLSLLLIAVTLVICIIRIGGIV